METVNIDTYLKEARIIEVINNPGVVDIFSPFINNEEIDGVTYLVENKVSKFDIMLLFADVFQFDKQEDIQITVGGGILPDMLKNSKIPKLALQFTRIRIYKEDGSAGKAKCRVWTFRNSKRNFFYKKFVVNSEGLRCANGLLAG